MPHLFPSRCHCGQCLNLGSLSSVLSSSLSASSSNTLTKGTKNSSHSAKCPMTNGNSQPWPPSSCTGGNNSFCPTHFPTGLLSCDEMNGISPSQLLPTALMMNNLNTCQCPACLNCRDMLCTDQVTKAYFLCVFRCVCIFVIKCFLFMSSFYLSHCESKILLHTYFSYGDFISVFS